MSNKGEVKELISELHGCIIKQRSWLVYTPEEQEIISQINCRIINIKNDILKFVID